jgi:general secretion pathway protein F/type IV pilus assembly protein PilC
MPTFLYEAISAGGQRSSGSLTAADRGEALRHLARKGLQPHVVREDTQRSTDAAPADKKATRDAGDKDKSKAEKAHDAQPLILKRSQVIQFTEELADLLHAGLQLEQALHAMENRKTSIMADLSRRLRDLVRDGVPFSTALQTVSPSFGELYANLVAAGEASGSLTTILRRQGKYLNTMESLRSKVIAALIYPAFIVVSGIALAIVFITYLLPKLILLIQNTGGKMPAIAMVLMSVSDFLKTWWWAILILIICVVVMVKLLLANKENLKAWHRMVLALPIYGPLLKTRFEVQFLETLGNLISNGLPLHRALELVRKTTLNLFLRDKLAIVESQVADGASLSRTLERTEAVRPLVVDMVRVGEQTGEMAEALEKAAERFDRQLERVLERATAAIQPVIIVVMAAMVGSMAWMMINVVYSTLENLRQH